MALTQCEYCQNVFDNRTGQKICPACTKEIDGVFNRVRKYMYSTDERVTATKLVEELDVPERALDYLIQDGRLILEPHSLNSGKCRVCGAPTDGHSLCSRCKASFSANMKTFEQENLRKQTLGAGKKEQHTFIKPLFRAKKD